MDCTGRDWREEQKGTDSVRRHACTCLFRHTQTMFFQWNLIVKFYCFYD